MTDERLALLEEKVFELHEVAIDLGLLTDKTDLDPLVSIELRAALADAMHHLSKAIKPLDRKLAAQGNGHHRVVDQVVMVESKPFEKRVYKGKPADLVREVTDTILDELEADNVSADVVHAAVAELTKVWTITPSKTPAMKAFKKLMGDKAVAKYFSTDFGDRPKIQVMPVSMYETIIGPAPDPGALKHQKRLAAAGARADEGVEPW